MSLTESGLAAAWETQKEIYFALLDRAKSEPSEIRATEKARYPVILTSQGGTKLITWKNDTQLEWQFFDRENQPEGSRGITNGDLLPAIAKGLRGKEWIPDEDIAIFGR